MIFEVTATRTFDTKNVQKHQIEIPVPVFRIDADDEDEANLKCRLVLIPTGDGYTTMWDVTEV